MHHVCLRIARRGLLSVLALLVATGSAAANYYELLRRVPESTNTLVLIDVERMLMSPIALREKWRDKANAPEAGTIVGFNQEGYHFGSPVGTSRAVAG